MTEHVAARCGEFRLLFPAENIGFIEPVLGQGGFREWRRRDRHAPGETVLDLRRLLGARAPATPEHVTLEWRSTDGSRRMPLLVDAVEQIVDCHSGDLIDASILPSRLRPMCSQVMRDPRGTLRLCVKTDVAIPMDRVADRRRFALALLTRDARAREVPR